MVLTLLGLIETCYYFYMSRSNLSFLLLIADNIGGCRSMRRPVKSAYDMKLGHSAFFHIFAGQR